MDMLQSIIDVLTFFVGFTIAFCVIDRIAYFLEKHNILKSTICRSKKDNIKEVNLDEK